jgi:hypothetical protein
MTLTRLLEINSKLLKSEEWPSISEAERIWRGYGSPTGVRELIDVLEKVLSMCGQYGIRYAPIFLQRKKALIRGTWAPQVCVASIDDRAKGDDSPGGACSMCGGTGYRLLDGGRGATLCSCDKWTNRQKVG